MLLLSADRAATTEGIMKTILRSAIRAGVAPGREHGGVGDSRKRLPERPQEIRHLPGRVGEQEALPLHRRRGWWIRRPHRRRQGRRYLQVRLHGARVFFER